MNSDSCIPSLPRITILPGKRPFYDHSSRAAFGEFFNSLLGNRRRYARTRRNSMLMTTRKNRDAVSLARYTAPIGAVFTDLLSLEFLLRLFLYERQAKPHNAFKPGQDLTGLRLGAVLPANALTDFKQLKNLIDRYNEFVGPSCPRLKIGPNLVDLRDALAHGRLFIRKNGLRLQLLKFTRPEVGKVKVNFSATLTLKWLAAQSNRLRDESAKVQRARGTFSTRRAA
jgi:hypothetical protein